MSASNPVADALAAITKHMDPSTGMLPSDWACRACAKTLNADGSHPAELYAGTFTGLCYSCERSGSYVVPGSELPDGARRVSHPPHCPSWRRSREEYWSYSDCEECGGAGRKMISRSNPMGGPYPQFCRPCQARVTSSRIANEVALLRAVAGALEKGTLATLPAGNLLTAAEASVTEACERVSAEALVKFARTPAPWRPAPYVLAQAQRRLTRAQKNAKRPATLRRHLVVALRAEADELERSSAS
jgi:hypothetical protein